MSGFLLVVLMILAVTATALCMWLTAAFDNYLQARREIRYRQNWRRQWRAYQRKYPREENERYEKYRSKYARRHPPNLRPTYHRSYDWIFQVLVIVGLALCVVLFWDAFLTWNRTDDRAAFTALCWFTAIAAVGLIVWYGLILLEMVIPTYARSAPHYRSPVPPLEEE